MTGVERQSGRLNAATEFGVSPTAHDNTARLTKAHAAAAAAGLDLFVPAGRYPMEAPLRLDSDVVCLSGAGSKLTALVFASPTGVHAGPSTFTDDLGSQGWVRDLAITGPGRPARGSGNAGLLLDTYKFATIERLRVSGFDVGYDLIGNCYGTDFRDVHSRYSVTNLALRLRSSLVQGNDHTFTNCWLGGMFAAVTVEPDAGTGADGLHFTGGQLTAGNGSTTDDDYGALTVGQTWETGAHCPGEASRVTLTNTTFEGVNRRWAIRLHTPCDVTATNVGFNLLGTGDQAAIGVLKHSFPYNDRIVLTNPRYWGATKQAPLSLTRDPGAHPQYVETAPTGWLNGTDMSTAGNGLFAGS